jgi:hypothetical protein
MGKSLVFLGLTIAGIGLLMMLGLPLGRLPGDIVYRRGNVTFVFPLATCILISVILTLIFTLLRR